MFGTAPNFPGDDGPSTDKFINGYWKVADRDGDSECQMAAPSPPDHNCQDGSGQFPVTDTFTSCWEPVINALNNAACGWDIDVDRDAETIGCNTYAYVGIISSPP